MANINKLTEALVELRPGALWTLKDDDYDTLKWYSEDIPIPTEAECIAKAAEYIAGLPLKFVRQERDKLLAETDWIVTKYLDNGQEMPIEWKNYRQALRDITNGANPAFGSDYSEILGITWPIKPTTNP